MTRGLSAVAVYTAVGLAGLLLARLLTRVDGSRRVRTAVLAAGTVAYGGLLVTLYRDGGLSRTVLAFGLASCVIVAGAVVLGSRLLQAVAGLAVLAVQAMATGSGAAGVHVALITVHLVAAAVWIGCVVHLALPFDVEPAAARRLVGLRHAGPYAICSGIVLTASGTVLAVADLQLPEELLSTTFGRVLLVKSLLFVAAAALGAAHSGWRVRRPLISRIRALRAEAGALAGVLGFAAALAALPLPALAVQVERPGLVSLAVRDADPVDLFVVATSPSTGLAALVGSESVRLVDLRSGRTTQLAVGGVTPVALAGGQARLAVTSGWQTVTTTVTAFRPIAPPPGDPATADVHGWTSYQLGRALAGGPALAQPAAAVTPCSNPTASVLGRALGNELRRTVPQAKRVYGVSDASTRADSFLRGLASSGVRVQRHPAAAYAVIATDAAGAVRTLTRLGASSTPPRAIYLAPWLLDRDVFAALTTTKTPPVLVAATLDPMSPVADAYRAGLASVAPGAAPSLAGLLGYEGPATSSRQSLRLYAATPVGFLPGVLDAGHDHGNEAEWFDSGSLVPVTDLQPLRCHSAPAHDLTGVS